MIGRTAWELIAVMAVFTTSKGISGKRSDGITSSCRAKPKWGVGQPFSVEAPRTTIRI
jgi:hypothetical protein